MICDLDRELRLGRLARHLGPVVKIDDPHARRFAYRRAGAGAVDPRDDRRAAEIVKAHRRAVMEPASAPAPQPRPAPDDLVELMAASLARAVRQGGLDLDDAAAAERALLADGFAPSVAGRPDLVGPATERARARLRRGAVRGGLADAAALGAIVLAWSAAYCVLCPPARAATAILTDEGLSALATWTPLLLAVLCILALCWADRGRPARAEAEAESEPAFAPPTAPDLPAIEARRRLADRG